MAYGVCDRHVKTGMEFSACAKSAGCNVSLEHKHTLSAPRQIGSTDQSVVPCPNNDRVVPIQSHTVFKIYGPTRTLVTACPQDFRAYTRKLRSVSSENNFDWDLDSVVTTGCSMAIIATEHGILTTC